MVHSFSAGTKDYEHTHTIHECKYNFASPRAIFVGTAHSYRYSHHKNYTQERYSRIFPSLGPGWFRFVGDHAPKSSHSRWFWFDSECPHANFCQGSYGIPIPAIGRILTPRGTKTLVPESTSPWPWFLDCPTLVNLKTGYDVLVNKHDCKVQEMYTVQDHPPRPTESLLLPSLDSLYKAHVRNQELPQPEDSWPVMPPSQSALSKQMMKKWEPWETNMWKSNNSRMLQQLVFHTQQIIKETSTQDLDPRPLANKDHLDQ